MRNMWFRSSAPVRPVGEWSIKARTHRRCSDPRMAVIQSLTAFARSAKEANELHTFHLACST